MHHVGGYSEYNTVNSNVKKKKHSRNDDVLDNSVIHAVTEA
jgi:hypothetical protein